MSPEQLEEYGPGYLDEDDYDDQAEEWQQGECDNCSGGDANGVTATGPLGPLYCACRIGQGADAEECQCGPKKGDSQ